MISLQVALHKKQVAAEAAVGQGSVKVFKLKFKFVENKTFFTNMFVSVQQHVDLKHNDRGCRKPL